MRAEVLAREETGESLPELGMVVDESRIREPCEDFSLQSAPGIVFPADAEDSGRGIVDAGHIVHCRDDHGQIEA